VQCPAKCAGFAPVTRRKHAVAIDGVPSGRLGVRRPRTARPTAAPSPLPAVPVAARRVAIRLPLALSSATGTVPCMPHAELYLLASLFFLTLHLLACRPAPSVQSSVVRCQLRVGSRAQTDN
jgi:hypothetical protein